MREKAVKVPGLEPEITLRPPRRQGSTPSRHSAKCRICNHPDRPAIEFDFLNWRNPADLARSYNLRDLTTIYRHAHATGLFAKRRLNLRFAMERIVERVNEVPVTATAVIRAARAITRINDAGEWNDPPTRLIIERSDSSDNSRSENHTSTQQEVQTRSRPAPIFDAALLDEPSESANVAGEMPRINGKPAGPEVILTLTPEFARCREVRWRGIEEDRRANAAKNAALIDKAPKSGSETLENDSLVGRGFNRDINAGSPSSSLLQQAQTPRGTGSQPVQDNSGRCAASGPATNPDMPPSSSSSLPQAVVPNSAQFASRSLHRDASSALTSTPSRDIMAARAEDLVASSSSTPPPARRGGEAAPDKPAAACPEQGRGPEQSPRAAGPPLGSSGTSDPPFPFIPRVPLRHHARRHFLIANETHSRGESND